METTLNPSWNLRKRRGKRDWKELTRFWRMTDDELADLYKEDDEEEDEEEYKEDEAEVNISSYPARILAGLFFFLSCRNINFRGSRAEIFRSGGFVQKYWSVTAARYCYVLSSQIKWSIKSQNKRQYNVLYDIVQD